MARKAKQVEETEVEFTVEPGDSVTFVGFSDPDSAPDHSDLLEEGEAYEVIEVIDPDDEGELPSVSVKVPNPDFDSSKRKTKNNREFFEVELLADEFSSADVEGDEEQEEEDLGAEIAWKDVKKGMVVTVTCTDGETEPLTGEIVAKTAKGLTILDGDEEVEYEKAEVAGVFEPVSDSDEEEEEAGDEEEEENTIEVDDIQKGMVVSLYTDADDEDPVVSGTVTAVLKAAIKVKDSETGEVMSVKKAEIALATEAEAEEEEEAPAPKSKAAAKTDSKAKTGTKGKAGKGKGAKAKAPEKEADEDLDSLVVLNDDEQDEEVFAMVEETGDDADQLCELAVNVADDQANEEFKLGGILYNVRKTKAFRKIEGGKYDIKGGFAEFAEEHMGIGYRKAMDLIQVYGTFCASGLGHEDYSRIKYSKAIKIARVMDQENAEELVEKAETSTVSDLAETIKESYATKGSTDGRASENRVKMVKFTFKLVEERATAVQEMLEQGAQSLGVKTLDEVFDAAITEWAAQNLDVSATRKSAGKGKAKAGEASSNAGNKPVARRGRGKATAKAA